VLGVDRAGLVCVAAVWRCPLAGVRVASPVMDFTGAQIGTCSFTSVIDLVVKLRGKFPKLARR
jgi:hypothetical protein